LADVELDGYRLVVRKAKSQAGTGRRPPIAEPLRPILLGEFMPAQALLRSMRRRALTFLTFLTIISVCRSRR
jgi:hypothetical protein